MADEEEERVLEEQLESQLHEQRDSLSGLDEALLSDPKNSDLLAVREELIDVIKHVEEGLLNLKRARLLREIDYSLHDSKEDVKAEPSDVKAEPLEDQSYNVGSKCRFRHMDGRWYNGLIVGMEKDSYSATVSFLTPTSENMLMCKFFLQQRCRFSSNCRLSHGVNVPVSSLKKYIPTIWDQSLVGSSILALSDSNIGIWREAELESWDEEQNIGNVVFRDDGMSIKLGKDALSLSLEDGEESDLGSEEYEPSDPSDYEEEGTSGGLGFMESTNMQRGIQTETAIFAKWENHTRGIASKMMANMGYREGMGLGVSGEGMVNPIPVRVLPARQSLDHAVEKHGIIEKKEHKVKRRSRGGKRIRERKIAAANRSAKEEENGPSDVFALINSHLGKVGVENKKEGNNGERKKEDSRRSLIAYDEEIKELKLRAEKLEEMVKRNRKEKVVYEAAMRKLNETRKAITDAETACASASNAVFSKEKEKRWLKF